MRILVVEDEPGIANFLRDGLQEESYAVDITGNGREGLEMAVSNEYDLILLDWMLPGISGIEMIRQFRIKNKSTPVIFLTAKDTVDETVFGLQSGANDYIKKPFAFAELLARIRVHTRLKLTETSVLEFKNIRIDLDSHSVFKGSLPVQLTQKEYALLEFLIRNKGKVCTRTRIIEHVWDLHFDSDTSVIDVYINYLRKKLDDDQQNSFINTIRGVGYILREENES